MTFLATDFLGQRREYLVAKNQSVLIAVEKKIIFINNILSNNDENNIYLHRNMYLFLTENWCFKSTRFSIIDRSSFQEKSFSYYEQWKIDRKYCFVLD